MVPVAVRMVPIVTLGICMVLLATSEFAFCGFHVRVARHLAQTFHGIFPGLVGCCAGFLFLIDRKLKAANGELYFGKNAHGQPKTEIVRLVVFYQL